jgi:hypothetical protein
MQDARYRIHDVIFFILHLVSCIRRLEPQKQANYITHFTAGFN